MFTILEQGIQAALAAGQAIPPALVNMKDEKFRSIDKEMYRLSNDLDRIADMLFNEFSGVGNTGAADRISDYALRYREATHTYVSPRDDAKPFLSQDKPLKVNLSGICEVINRINAAREARQASTERMKAGANAMVWEGEDATLARIQWNLMSGPGSNHQIITDGMLQFTQAMTKSLEYYMAAQDNAYAQGNEILIPIQKLRDLAAWTDRVYWATLPLKGKAIALKAAAAPILTPGETRRLNQIIHLDLDRLKGTRKDLIRAADLFEEADRKADKARQEAADYFNQYPPNGSDYADLQERSALIAETVLPVLNQYREFDCRDITQDGSVVFQYFTIRPDGGRTYNWDAIQESFAGTLETTTEQDYAELLRLVGLMTTTDPQGAIIPDTEALSKLIDSGYGRAVTIHVSNDMLDGAMKSIYTPTPVFQAFCALYELQTNLRIRQNPALIYDSDPQNPQRQTLLADMTKSALLMEMITNKSRFEWLDARARITILAHLYPSHWGNTHATQINGITSFFNAGIWRDNALKWDRIGYGDSSVGIHDFTFDNKNTLDANSLQLIHSMYRDKGREFRENLGMTAIGEIFGMATGEFSLAVTGIMFAFDVVVNNAEVDGHNQKLDEVSLNLTLDKTLGAMKAGATVTVYHNEVTVRNICINERELQIAINAHNASRSEENRLDMKTLLNEFYGMGETGQVSNIVSLWVDWYWDNQNEVILKYWGELEGIFNQYGKLHPEFPYNRLDNLTPEQINELEKKRANPDDYVLNLEVSP